MHACVRHIIQNNIEDEFKQHSKESRGVLGEASKQAGKRQARGRQASRPASRQARVRQARVRQAGRPAIRQRSRQASK